MTSMRRVVVTGMGIISCIGNDLNTVTESLRQAKPGIRFSDEYAELGLKSQIYGKAEVDIDSQILIRTAASAAPALRNLTA